MMDNNDDQDILTTLELAAVMGVTKQTIYAWLKQGLPTHNRGTTGPGLGHTFSRKTVALWMALRREEFKCEILKRRITMAQNRLNKLRMS